MKPPNVLLVILDSARARNCSLYGHRNRTTPELEQFAENATLFEQARSPGIHSIASHVSIFSGYHVEQHELTEFDSQLDPEHTIWKELRGSHGYRTGLFTPNVIITETSNLNEPFNTVIGPDRRRYNDALAPADLPGNVGYTEYLKAALNDDRPLAALLNGGYSKLLPRDRSGETYVDALLNWVDEEDAPWAACLNLMDSHYPYTPDPEYDEWGGDLLGTVQKAIPGESSIEYLGDRPWGQLTALEPLYDGGIRQADSAVGKLLRELRTRDMYDDTLVVVTSDHGEGFGERSLLTPAVRYVDHSWGVGEVMTHVPLVVKAPGQTAGRTVSDLATLTNIPNAIRGTVAGELPADALVPDDGRVLTSTFLQRPPADHLPIPEAERTQYFGPWRAVYERDDDGVLYKYATRAEDSIKERIEDAQVSFRDGNGDAEMVCKIFDDLERVDIGTTGTGEVDEGVQERLADLGYLR
jgi:arylsulfatase A-like enzyme